MVKIHFLTSTLLFLIIGGVISYKNAPLSKTTYQEGFSERNIKEELNTDLQYTVLDPITYKDAAISKIRQNDRRLTFIKEKIKTRKKDLKPELVSQLTDLEKRNFELTARIHYLDAYNPDKLDDFKHRFNNDLNKIGKSITEIAELAYN